MNAKVIYAIVAIIIIVAGAYFVFGNQMPEIEFPWGDESVEGTASINLYAITEDGERIPMSNTNPNPLGGILYNEYSIVGFDTTVCMEYTDMTNGMIDRVDISQTGSQLLMVNYLLTDGQSTQDLDAMAGGTGNQFTIPGEGTANTKCFDFGNELSCLFDENWFNGEVTLTITASGSATYEAIGESGTVYSTGTTNVPDGLSETYTLWFGDVINIDWSMNPAPQ